MNDLQVYAREYGIELDQIQLEQFCTYTAEMLCYNEKVNLTAITKPEEILIKHFLDSILPLHAFLFPQGASMIDIGTGAGFPGIPLKIVRKDLALTLLDSLEKRLKFLRHLSVRLEQDNRIIHGRAEELAHQSDFRGQFDIVVSRAVASLPALAEYCLGYVKCGGVFLCLKGLDYKAELELATSAIETMGGKLESVKEYKMPGDNNRSILVIKKISQTPANLPRKRVNISKTPIL